MGNDLNKSKEIVIDRLKSLRNTSIFSSIFLIVFFGITGFSLWDYTIFGFGQTFFKIYSVVSFCIVIFGFVSIFSSNNSTAKQIKKVKAMDEQEYRQYIHDTKVGLGKAVIKLASKFLNPL